MRIWIIGWGAAGMMCAASLLHHMKASKDVSAHTDKLSRAAWTAEKIEIHLFEKNPKLGAKVIISGGWRCNVTTWITDKKELLTKYIRGADFLKQALGILGPKKIYERFEEHGVPLKTEEDQRVFPVSDDGKDIVWAFEKLFAKEDVHVHLKSSVTKIVPASWGFDLTTSEWQMHMDAVVLTTWWTAYRHTWSTGDGYSFAESCGHTITPLGPSLNSFLVEEQRIKELSWIAFEHAGLSFEIADKTYKTVKWPILCTHFGISWPVTFVLSAYLAYETIDQTHPKNIRLIPDTTKNHEQLTALFIEWTKQFPARQLKTQLHTLFPDRVVEKICQVLWCDPTQQLAHFTKEQRKQLIEGLTRGLPLQLIARRPGDEFVTAWGVLLDEVHAKSMQSKITPGLYFAWEILDIDGVTWWFNLTSSRATWWLAGKSICNLL